MERPKIEKFGLLTKENITRVYFEKIKENHYRFVVEKEDERETWVEVMKDEHSNSTTN